MDESLALADVRLLRHVARLGRVDVAAGVVRKQQVAVMMLQPAQVPMGAAMSGERMLAISLPSASTVGRRT